MYWCNIDLISLSASCLILPLLLSLMLCAVLFLLMLQLFFIYFFGFDFVWFCFLFYLVVFDYVLVSVKLIFYFDKEQNSGFKVKIDPLCWQLCHIELFSLATTVWVKHSRMHLRMHLDYSGNMTPACASKQKFRMKRINGPLDWRKNMILTCVSNQNL